MGSGTCDFGDSILALAILQLTLRLRQSSFHGQTVPNIREDSDCADRAVSIHDQACCEIHRDTLTFTGEHLHTLFGQPPGSTTHGTLDATHDVLGYTWRVQ